MLNWINTWLSTDKSFVEVATNFYTIFGFSTLLLLATFVLLVVIHLVCSFLYIVFRTIFFVFILNSYEHITAYLLWSRSGKPTVVTIRPVISTTHFSNQVLPTEAVEDITKVLEVYGYTTDFQSNVDNTESATARATDVTDRIVYMHLRKVT